MAITSPYNLDESPEEAYQRMVEDLPAPAGGGEWNTRAGSVLHAILQPVAIEITRIKSYAYDYFTSGFLLYAQEAALDAKVAEYGLFRREAVASEVTLTVTGDEGTTINPGDSFATVGNTAVDGAGVEFLAVGGPYTIAVGETTVSFLARSSEVGEFTNVDAGTVVLFLSAVPGAESVTNANDAEGGRDTETDEELRARALTRAQLLPASGNKATYIAIASEYPGVDEVTVEDLWRGAGTGKVVLSRFSPVHVTPEMVDTLQQVIDPSVFTLAHFEGPENWVGTDGEFTSTAQLEGASSLVINTAAPSTTVNVYLDKVIDLSFWDADQDYLEIYVRKETADATYTDFTVRLTDGDGDYVEALFNNAALTALTGEGVLSMARSALTETGTFNWADVQRITLYLESSGSGSASLTVDGLRIYSFAGGHGEGEAPIGIQITVVSSKATTINVAATVYTTPGVLLADIEQGIKNAIEDAIQLTAIDDQVVRISRIANAIHDYVGVLDYSSITLAREGDVLAASNIELAAGERPRAGTITLTPGV